MPPNSHERADFLRAICAAPDDDAPRLIYADWLDENGEDEPATFIREQIRLARLPCWHPDVLEARFTQRDTFTGAANPTREVLPPLPEGLAWDDNPYVRGLPERVRLVTHAGTANLVRLCRDVAPVRRVTIDQNGLDRPTSTAASLLDDPVLLSIIEVRCRYRHQQPTDYVLSRLRRSRYRGMVRRLSLDIPQLTEEEAPLLLDSHLFRQLESFALEINSRYVRGDHFFRALRTLKSASSQLQQLDLDNVVLFVGQLVDLANTPGLQSLRELTLTNLHALILNDYWELLPNSRYLQNLEVLRCSGFSLNLQPSELLQADRFRALRWLALNNNQIHAGTVHILADTTFLSSLTCLELAANPLDNRGAKRLADVPFTQLAVLNLRECAIDNDGALKLAQAPFAANLRLLDLSNNNLDEKTQQRLRDLFGPRVRL